MEQNIDTLLCAINVIRKHCKKHIKCDDCILLDVKNDSCRVTGVEDGFPSDWDKPELKERKEIVF